jgi:hypothetical protein
MRTWSARWVLISEFNFNRARGHCKEGKGGCDMFEMSACFYSGVAGIMLALRRSKRRIWLLVSSAEFQGDVSRVQDVRDHSLAGRTIWI